MWDSFEGRSKMFCRLLILVFFGSLCWSPAVSRVIQKRAAFYIANETMCIVDGEVYRNGDPVPTDDECERCTCRPPGFSCVLRDCDTKPGCKAVRRAGECCPEYVCGCVHNSRLYEDGELIRDLQNNCYTCRCHGSSISCTFADCHFRGDCPPEYIPGECCPRYDHCPPISTTTTTTTTQPTTQYIIQQETEFVNLTTQHLEKFTDLKTTVTVQDIVTKESDFTTSSDDLTKETLFTVQFTLSGEKFSSIQDYDATEATTILPLQTVNYKETTKHIVSPPGTELTTLKDGLIVRDFNETTTVDLSESSEEPEILGSTEIDSSTIHSIGLGGVESTTHDSYSSCVDDECLSTTKSEEVTESDSEASKDDELLHFTDDGDKISTIQEAEASTFFGDSKLPTIKQEESTDYLQPVFVTAQTEKTKETEHEQNIYSETESDSSNKIEVDSSKKSDVPVIVPADLTSTEFSEISTSSEIPTVSEISADYSLDPKSTATDHTVDKISDEFTSEQSETTHLTESAHDDLQTSSDELHTVTATLLSHTSESTISDSDNLYSSNQTGLEEESASTVDDLTTKETEISHSTTIVSQQPDSEHETDHESETTSLGAETTFSEISESSDSHLKVTTDDEHGDASDLSSHESHDVTDVTTETSDSETVSPETDSLESDIKTTFIHPETVSDSISEDSVTSIHHNDLTEIFDMQSPSSIESSTSYPDQTSNIEEVSLKTQETFSDHKSTAETKETDFTIHSDVETTTLLYIPEDKLVELDSSTVHLSTSVDQSEPTSNDTDRQSASDSQETSGTFEETLSTSSELSSVSYEQDLTAESNSLKKTIEPTSVTSTDKDISSQASISFDLEETEESDTTSISVSSENTIIHDTEQIISKEAGISTSGKITENESETSTLDTGSEESSHEDVEGANSLTSSEISESEESSSIPVTYNTSSETATDYTSESQETDEESHETTAGAFNSETTTAKQSLENETLYSADSEIAIYAEASDSKIETGPPSTIDKEEHIVFLSTTKDDSITDHGATVSIADLDSEITEENLKLSITTGHESQFDSESTSETSSETSILVEDGATHSVTSIDLNNTSELYLPDNQLKEVFTHPSHHEIYVDGTVSTDHTKSTTDISELNNETDIGIKEEDHHTSVRHTITSIDDISSPTEVNLHVTSDSRTASESITDVPRTDMHSTQTDSDFHTVSVTVTETSSQSTTEESESDIDAVHVKHDSEVFATHGTTSTQSESAKVTSLKPPVEKITTTPDSDIPSENPAFEPPMANILKQSMLFNRPTEKVNESNLMVSDFDENGRKNFSSNQNHTEKLPLTVAEENNENVDNTTFIYGDSENKIFVLNHEYTISDLDVNDTETSDLDGTENIPEEPEDLLHSVHIENKEHVQVFTDQISTTNSFELSSSATNEESIHHIQIDSENQDSPSLIPEEVFDSEEFQKETTERENITSGIIKDLNLLSEALESHSLSHDQDSPNAINIENIQNIYSVDNSTSDLQKVFGDSSPEDYDTLENSSSVKEDNESTDIKVDLIVTTTGNESTNLNSAQFDSEEMALSQEFHENNGTVETLSESQTIPQHGSTNGNVNYYAEIETTNDDSDAGKYTFASVEDDNDHYSVTSESITEMNEPRPESLIDISDETSNEETILPELDDISFDPLQENHNETDTYYSYQDSENVESSEDEKETPTAVSINNLGPELITALQDISTSLMFSLSDSSNDSAPINDEYDYLSTPSDDKDIENPSTVTINILFGQHTADSLHGHKTSETNLEESKNTNDINTSFHLNNKDTIPGGEVEESNERNETEPSTLQTDETGESQNVETDIDFEETLNTSHDTDGATELDKHIDGLVPESTTEPDSINFPDKNTSPDEHSTVREIGGPVWQIYTLQTESVSDDKSDDSESDAEDSSSPFTILEYIGDLFSGFSTFSTLPDSNESISTQGADLSNRENQSEIPSLTDTASSIDNLTPSSDQSYISHLKNQFVEYGSLGGVFITGQSKYNKSSSVEQGQQFKNDSLEVSSTNLTGYETQSSIIDNITEVVHHNSDTGDNTETETDAEELHSTFESKLNVEISTQGTIFSTEIYGKEIKSENDENKNDQGALNTDETVSKFNSHDEISSDEISTIISDSETDRLSESTTENKLQDISEDEIPSTTVSSLNSELKSEENKNDQDSINTDETFSKFNSHDEIGSDEISTIISDSETDGYSESTTEDKLQDTSKDEIPSTNVSSLNSEEKSGENVEVPNMKFNAQNANDTLITGTDDTKEAGPEKGGEWFDPLDPKLTQANNEKEESVTDTTSMSDNVEIIHDITTETSTGHGPEKGGDVFEPSFPEIFPIGSVNSEITKDNITTESSTGHGPEKGGDVFEPSFPEIFPIGSVNSEITIDNVPDNEGENIVTENSAGETEVLTLKTDLNSPRPTSDSSPGSISETSTSNPLKAEFIPPLPILLRDIHGSFDADNAKNVDHNQNANIYSDENLSEEESALSHSKVENARSIQHPYMLSDVISQVFKAPGYDSEVHLSPLIGFPSLKRSQIVRLKRNTKKHSENQQPIESGIKDSSSYTPSNRNPTSSFNEDISPINNKNILLVEGYGYKPSGFIPVTSSFIIVHADEDSDDNETGVNPKQKTSPGHTEINFSEIEFLDEIPPRSPEKESKPSGLGNTHPTK